MYHDERMFREDDRGHAETTQVSIPKDVIHLNVWKFVWFFIEN